MPVRKISEHCLQIRRFNCMNAYLVRETDGLTVVDTSMAAAAIIVAAARELAQPIRRILLTHGHLDHVGSLDELKRLAPDATIIIGQRESLLLRAAAEGIHPSRMTLLPGEPQTPVKGDFKKLKNLPGQVITDNDCVGTLRAISTPGHTPGHLAFFDERDGSLYAGDALVTFGGIRLPFDPPWWFPLPKMATWHFPAALASARRLCTLDASRILAGHGPAIESPRAALNESIERAARLLP